MVFFNGLYSVAWMWGIQDAIWAEIHLIKEHRYYVTTKLANQTKWPARIARFNAVLYAY